LPSRLLSVLPVAGQPPSSTQSARPITLGPAPSLRGILCGGCMSCHNGGPPPPSAGCDTWREVRCLQPSAPLAVSSVSSRGAAHPRGGPLVASPRSACASLAVLRLSSPATTSTSATVSVTLAAAVGHVAVSVARRTEGPPGPAQATPTSPQGRTSLAWTLAAHDPDTSSPVSLSLIAVCTRCISPFGIRGSCSATSSPAAIGTIDPAPAAALILSPTLLLTARMRSAASPVDGRDPCIIRRIAACAVPSCEVSRMLLAPLHAATVRTPHCPASTSMPSGSPR
jgi:hypothetical protein